MDTPTSTPTPPDHRETYAHERLVAVRNALFMGAALVVSWSIALSVRLVIPRYLGPERFGSLNFADGFAAAFFVMSSLGIDSYTRREIPLRPKHASDFLGGVFVVRLGLSVLLLAAMVFTLRVTHRSREAEHLALIFGVGQLFFITNGTFAALLQAGGSVRRMSVFNVLSKVIWGGAIFLSLFLNLGLWALALSFLLSEAIRAVAFWRIASKEAGLELRFSTAATKQALLGSLPFFVFAAAQGVYTRLDVTFIEMLVNTREVGWYGAASSCVAIAMMAAPLMHWVLLPMLVRARTRSVEDFDDLVRGSLRLLFAFSIPLVLAIELGAGWLVVFLFGPAYAPAAISLRAQGPLWVGVYTNMAISIALTAEGRAWTVTNLSLLGMVLTVLLNFILVPTCAHLFGPGGGGAGSAVATVVTELTITAVMIRSLGVSRTFDRRTYDELRRTALVVVVVVGLDLLLATRLGPVRLLIDAATYVVLILALGAFPINEVLTTVRDAIRHRAPGS